MANEVLGFEITELRLGLPGNVPSVEKNGKKRVFSEMTPAGEDENGRREQGRKEVKNQVVGWPPICSYRQKNHQQEKNHGSQVSKCYVKVSMDGAPFLRKIDLNMYTGYSVLSHAFEKLFGCFSTGNIFGKDPEFSDFVPIYEDKDGDWMLVGDVPWEMFTESCRRLRIMKRSEAAGFGLELRSTHGRLERHKIGDREDENA